MFAPSYFAPRYFAPRYWPPGRLDLPSGGQSGAAGISGYDRIRMEDDDLLSIILAFLKRDPDG